MWCPQEDSKVCVGTPQEPPLVYTRGMGEKFDWGEGKREKWKSVRV